MTPVDTSMTVVFAPRPTDLVGPINPVGFSGERYFFTFTNDATRMPDTYTETKKSNWLKCLQAYHSLCKTRSKDDYPIEQLRSDYGFELQSHEADEWIEKEGIIFESLALYFQDQTVSPTNGKDDNGYDQGHDL